MAIQYDHSGLPFKEAIAALLHKFNIDTDNWRDIQGIEHQALFMVASAKGRF